MDLVASLRSLGFALAVAVVALAPAPFAAALSGSLAGDRALAPSDVPAGPFPKLLRDPFGNERALSRAPTRIVSAMLAADEMLIDLVDPRNLAGLTFLIDEPSTSVSARRAPRHPARIEHGQIEPIVALEPDLVVVAGYTPADVVVQLLAMGTPVVRLERYSSFADVERNLETLARSTGTEARSAEVISDLRERIARVRKLPPLVPAPRVLYWGGSYTKGRGTLVDECIRLAGGANVTDELGLTQEVSVGVEAALASDPDVIFVPIPEERVRPNAPELLVPEAHWRASAAFRSCSVHGLPVAWTGAVSHHVVLALEAMAALLRGHVP